MAFITNGLIAIFSFWAFFSLRKESTISIYWKMFFFFLAFSMTFGAMGHTFFEYFGMLGKTPSWVLGTVATVCSSFAILQYNQRIEFSNAWVIFVYAKGVILLVLSLVTLKFIFVAIDTIVSYLLFTGYYAYRLKNIGFKGMKYMLIGVGILLPSAFIFLFKINISRWLDKNDLSHLLMLGGIIFFYIGAKKTQSNQIRVVEYV